MTEICSGPSRPGFCRFALHGYPLQPGSSAFSPLTPAGNGRNHPLFPCCCLPTPKPLNWARQPPSQEVELQRLERFVVPGHEPNRHRESLLLLSQLGLADGGLTTLDAIGTTHGNAQSSTLRRLRIPPAGSRSRYSNSEKMGWAIRPSCRLTWSAFYTAAPLDMLPYDAQTQIPCPS